MVIVVVEHSEQCCLLAKRTTEREG